MSCNKTLFIIFIVISNLWKNFEVHATSEKNEESRSEPFNMESNNTCTSPTCILESKALLNNMDRGIDPCDDFFSFACGGFIKNTLIPKNEYLVTQFGRLNKKIQDNLMNELRSGIQPNDLEAFKKIKNFYVNCINESRVQKDGITPILELIEKLGGWPVLRGNKWKEDEYQWENTVSLISKAGLLPDFPFTVDVGYDTNLRKYIVDVRGVRIGVDNSYNMTDQSSRYYMQFMADIAIYLGAANETAFNEIKECVEFECKLFKALYSIDDTTDNFLPVKRPLKVWATKYPELPWMNFFNNIFSPSNVTVTEDDILLIHEPHYVSRIVKLLNDTPKRTLANHQIWRVLYYYVIKFAPKEFRMRCEKFKELIEEKERKLPRENECLNFLQQHSPVALNSLYLQKFVNKSGKSEQLYILENVRIEARKYFEELEWMDDEVRKTAFEKLDTLTGVIDYPDELLNNTKVENFFIDTYINLGSSLYSYLNITRAEKNYALRLLRHPCKESGWARNTHVASVTANYDSDHHRINVATGILQSPFFNLDRPKYLNYGGLGFTIGHEIIHGIETTDGKKYHAIVLKNSTIEEYRKRAKCIMDQFSNYTISEAYGNVDGERTYMENIADAGGFKLGYYAYNNWLNANNISEPPLPGLNYTPHQLYWISIASCLCSKINETVQLFPVYMSNDVHSPEEARINVGLANVIEFAKDFKCPVGSRLNPARKCIVW